MTASLRTLFFIFLGLLLLWFLYLERGILHPFILAAIFAYIFNPMVNFISDKVKLPRAISIIIIYGFLIACFVGLGIVLTQRITSESDDIRNFTNKFLHTANTQITTFPDWARPTIYDLLNSIKKNHFFTPASIIPFFPQALSRLVSFIIFLFSAFYFLKDGKNAIELIIRLVPKDYRGDIEMLLKKINATLGGYLRGEIFLVFLMSLLTFIALTALGVRFALVVAIFSGFAEIVPVIGPIIAATIAILVVLFTGTANFGLQPLQTMLIVIVIYFILRNLEDYFIIPHVMGKITKLPPFIIFFAVIAGGHLWGILGLILAVPTAAVIKIFLEYSFDLINGSKRHKIPGSE